HLGQVLTYLSGLEDAAVIIWIAEEVREEHRAAIDWLNTNTLERFSFFAVEIELLRIGDSPPAPRFSIVASPNDWSRTARSSTRSIGKTPSSETEARYLDYWRAFRAFALERDPGFRVQKAWARQWLPMRIGRSGFMTNACLNGQEKWVRAELYIQMKHGYPKLAFRALSEEREAIEREFGEKLQWEDLPGKQAVRIAVYRQNSDFQDESTWAEQHAWLYEKTEKLRAVFQERVAALDFDELEERYAPSEAADAE
ncbi:MAG TPA: DUF4268 domain-containing protein, partial [Kiloniellaceae bacterium]|nr:DUF4268 domain-containing protein [Kiloniellaceae bacterium]